MPGPEEKPQEQKPVESEPTQEAKPEEQPASPPDQKPEDSPKDQQPAPTKTSEVEDLETIKKTAKQYEESKPLIDAYTQFDEILSKDEEIRGAVETAIKGVVEKRKGSAPQPGQNQNASQPSQGQTGSNNDFVQLRNEIRMKDYVQEFNRAAQAAGVSKEIMQEAFDGTVAELMKVNPDPMGNFKLDLVEASLKKWVEKADKIAKARNAAYVAKKETDNVPQQGGGQPPKAEEPKLLTQESRRNFIAEGMRAAGWSH